MIYFLVNLPSCVIITIKSHLEHFCPPSKITYAPLLLIPISPSPLSRKPIIYFVCLDLPFCGHFFISGIIHSTVCCVWLLSHNKTFSKSIHISSRICSLFAFIAAKYPIVWTYHILLLIQSLLPAGIVPSFGLLWTMQLWPLLYKSLGGRKTESLEWKYLPKFSVIQNAIQLKKKDLHASQCFMFPSAEYKSLVCREMRWVLQPSCDCYGDVELAGTCECEAWDSCVSESTTKKKKMKYNWHAKKGKERKPY